MNVHDFDSKTIAGAPKKLSEYKGRVLLIVNVASKCGLTPQYKALEALHKELSPRGLSVLGFPANEFGAQEPGTEAQISEFCSTNYGVEFDMFQKTVVKGAGIAPLFAHLTDTASGFGGEIKWNFNKFLVDKDGNVAGRFEPTVSPDDPALLAAIQKLLG
jgi:glutathione peroxidase